MARGKKDKVIKDVDGTIKFPTSLDIGKLKDKAIPNLSNVPLEITNSDIQIPNNIETTKDFEKNSHVHVFSVEKPLYLQIHIGNIYTIFGSGIITPSAYLPNRPFIDIQTHLEEGIILSNGAVNQLDDTQLLLEVSLSKNELQEIAVHDQLGFFCKPLPISRIKKIYVSSEAIKTDIVNTALSNDGGIIPKKLIFAHFPASLPLTTLHTPSPHLIYSDHSERLRLFDKFMGAIAYIKNYSLLIANKTSLLSPMPKHYFYALQALNNSPELQLVKDERAFSFYQQLFNYKEVENPLMRWLLERINTNENFVDNDIQEFGRILLRETKAKESLDLYLEVFTSLSKSLERKAAINKIYSIQDSNDKFYLYLFAFLRLYGNIDSENKSIARADLSEFNPLTYSIYAFSLLGYFFGYNNLRNFEDKIVLEDKGFIKYLQGKSRFAIKFEMETLLDYIIIESIYSSVFLQKNADVDVSFIHSESIGKELVITPTGQSKDYSFLSNIVFGKFYYTLTKKQPNPQPEKLTGLPINIPIVSELGVLCNRILLPKHYGNIADLWHTTRYRYFTYFKKDDLIKAISNKKVTEDEVEKRLQISVKNREFDDT